MPLVWRRERPDGSGCFFDGTSWLDGPTPDADGLYISYHYVCGTPSLNLLCRWFDLRDWPKDTVVRCFAVPERAYRCGKYQCIFIRRHARVIGELSDLPRDIHALCSKHWDHDDLETW